MENNVIMTIKSLGGSIIDRDNYNLIVYKINNSVYITGDFLNYDLGYKYVGKGLLVKTVILEKEQKEYITRLID